ITRRRVLAIVAALLVVSVLGVVLAVALGRDGAADPAADQIGRPAPGLAGPTLDGGRVELAGLRGSVVLVNVFASWCGPCRDELPLLADAQRRWAARGFRVIGVDVRDGPDAARALLAQTGADQLTVLPDPTGVIAVDWGAVGVPETYLVGPDGRIEAWERGPVTAGWLQRRVDPLLGKPAPGPGEEPG
ncbi:TlpA family protein disulfide reductase, partial [Micromonospora zhanjiangensis]